MNDKLLWGATLRPGDIVNDCRYKDLKIKTITPCYYDGVRANLKGNGKEIFDYDIILEDGANCSLMHCCNRPEDIPQEIKDKYR